jgi:surface polysaccharide O-acyltransferase-like enzyme
MAQESARSQQHAPPAGEARSGVDPRLNLLKVLASFGVIMVHTAVLRVSQVDLHSLGWWVANIGDAAGRLGSSMFVMVGGAVLLARPAERDPWGMVGQRLSRLLPALLFWSVFYFAWRQWMWGGMTWAGIVQDVVLGSPWYHLWFMYMMLGLYLMMPAMRYAVLGVGDGPGWRHLLAVAAGMTWFVSIAQTLQKTSHASFIGLAPLFIVYFLGGYYLLRRQVRLTSWQLWLGVILAIAGMAGGVALLYPALKEWAFVLFYSNRSPFAMMLTFCVFLLALRFPAHRVPAWVNHLGKATLGIYAIHPFWIDMLARWGYGLAQAGSYWPLMTLLVFALSAVTSLALFSLPPLRRLVS